MSSKWLVLMMTTSDIGADGPKGFCGFFVVVVLLNLFTTGKNTYHSTSWPLPVTPSMMLREERC